MSQTIRNTQTVLSIVLEDIERLTISKIATLLGTYLIAAVVTIIVLHASEVAAYVETWLLYVTGMLLPVAEILFWFIVALVLYYKERSPRRFRFANWRDPNLYIGMSYSVSLYLIYFLAPLGLTYSFYGHLMAENAASVPIFYFSTILFLRILAAFVRERRGKKV